MRGRGRLIATDSDKRQLAPIHERLKRAGVHNVEVRTPKGNDDPLSDLAGRCDIVVIDAPCTGTGTWRRNPDAKWRMRPGALDIRIKDQVEVLDRAVPLLKRGGRIAYITCSVLQEENSDQISAFIARHDDFVVVPPLRVASKLGPSAKSFCDSAALFDEGLLMTPHRTGTDGFFVAVLKRPQ
jgi:16S rRNA (cytosine967-C5)-methyltransferase